MTKKSKDEFYSLIKDITNNQKFNILKKELHHGISRFDHSLRVAKWTYLISKFFKLKKKEETTKAALLHDFYIDEDLKEQKSIKKLGTHPNMALENSLKYFDLNELQKDIIAKHMFPCTLDLPKYKETWLVSFIDKMVSIYEMFRFKAALYIGIYVLFLFEVIRLPR